MSDNKRNIDNDDIDRNPAKPSQGNQSPMGTGTHDANRREAEAETADNKAKGNEARLSGYGKGNTQPEKGRN